MANRVPLDYNMEDEDNMSHSSYPSAASSVRSGPAAYGMGISRNQHVASFPTSFSVASDNTELSLKRDREREGRCSECGVQTHEFRLDRMTGRHLKVPLTMENEVHRGRCLLCFPIHPVVTHPITYSTHSTRSLGTVSTLGNYSAPGGSYPRAYSHCDPIESASIVTTSSAVDEALLGLEDEGSDLLDILTAMRRFPTDRRIQEKGLEKLWIQSWDEDNSIAIGRVGGIDIILDAMRMYAASPQLQLYGCEALQNLANNEYNRDSIGEHGGIQAVVQAMNVHTQVVGVQQAGCTALANMAASRDHHMGIADAGGLHAIVNAAHTFSEEEHVLRAAYQALRAMGYDPQRHGQQAQQQQAQQQQQQQQQQAQQQQQQQPRQMEGEQEEEQSGPQEELPPRQQQQHEEGGEEQGRSQNVIRLDAYGFPIN